MANAWIVAPLPVTAAVTTAGTLQKGAGTFLFNDYAGVVCQLACDQASNSASIVVDLGADRTIDTVLAFGVELFPSSGSLTVDYATSAQGAFTGAFGSGAGAALAGSAAMSSGKGVSLWSSAAAVTARYIRLTYAATSTGRSVRLARLVIGKRIQLERNFSYGAAFGVRDLGSLDFSARGVLLRRRGAKLRTVSLTFSHVRKDEVESVTKPLLEQIGNTEMVAIVTDPAANPQLQNRCYFGPLVGDLSHTWVKAASFEAKTNCVSIF